MSQLAIEPLHADFGARVTGLALSGALSDGELAEIRAAIDRYSVLCFPGQDMTDDKQLAFTRRLGEPEPEHVRLGTTGEVVFFGTVGNVQPDGAREDNAHAWRAGDTVIWDNRCMLHRGTGYDADRWRRRLRQTRVIGSERGVVPGAAPAMDSHRPIP